VTDPKKSTRGLSFDTFVNGYCEAVQPEFAAVGSQSVFLAERKGKGVDHLFRYEDIGRFVQFLEDRLGCEIHLPRLNVSPAADLELAPETVARMEEAMVDDFVLYGSIRHG